MLTDILAIVLNLVIVSWTSYTLYWWFNIRDFEHELLPKQKIGIFRFFTYQSNILSAAVSLVFLIYRVIMLVNGRVNPEIPEALIILRLISTAAVEVTLLTVIFFLAPSMGWVLMYKADCLYMHTLGPVFALLSLILFDRDIYIGFPLMLTGMISVVLYSFLYLYKVVRLGEENGGWPDFYGFNRNGMWPVSIIAMYAAAFLISAGISALHNLMIR